MTTLHEASEAQCPMSLSIGSEHASAATHVDEFSFPSPEVTQCPFPFYAAMRADAPVYKYPGRNEFFIARRSDILDVLKQTDIFSNEGWRADARLKRDVRDELPDLPPMPESSVIKTPFQMTSVDPPEHTVKRRAASELVHRKRLEAAGPLIQRIANELIDGWIESGAIEFRSAFANPMAVTTICELAGFPREDRPKYLSWNRNSTGHGRRYLTDEQLAKQEADKPDQAEYCRQIILDRYENPRDDFLSWFIADQVERDGALNLPYLVTEVNLILVAGNETTSRLLANAMLLLLRNPTELEKVLADRTLVESAIEETLRFESPTQWTSRYCVKDTEIGGVAIPAGSFVMLLYGSANRDETWDDPDQFRVDRKDIKKHQMAFGGGPHLCLGKGVARLEGKLALEILLDRLKNVRLAPGKNDFRNIDNFQKRVAEELYIEFDPGTKVLG